MSETQYVVPALAASVARVTHANATEKKQPREAVLALEMLAEGKNHEDIQRETGLGLAAIASLRARHEMVLEERRKQLATDGYAQAEMLRLLAMKKMEQLAEDPEALKKVNIRDLVISGAITQDKVFAALGEASRVVVEHKGKGVSLDDAVKAIEEARAKVRAASVEVNVTPAEASQ